MISLQSSLVQFSCSVMSNSLRPHGLQHARPLCPSPTPGTYAKSCPSSQWPSNHLILCRPLLLRHSIFPRIRVFSNESALRITWPKDWSFIISPSNEYPGLIFFRIDWFDLHAVQGTLRSLLQHHNLKASILRHSVFFIVYPTLTSVHDYWKNQSLDNTFSAFTVLSHTFSTSLFKCSVHLRSPR